MTGKNNQDREPRVRRRERNRGVRMTVTHHNARYAKLRRQVGKSNLDISKIVKTKELLNSTTLPIKHQCHVFFQKIVEVLDIQRPLITALNHIHSLIGIKLSFVIRNMWITISCDQHTFTIKRPIVYARQFFCACKKRIDTVGIGGIRIHSPGFYCNVIS